MTTPAEFGATAWGRAWRVVIERPQAMPSPHLPAARSLARNQRANLMTTSGDIQAAVTDRSATHNVRIRVPLWEPAPDEAARALLLAAGGPTLAGDLPDALISKLAAVQAPPAAALETLTSECSCRARTKPCVHIFGTLYALVLKIDERPLLAVELRTARPLIHEPGSSYWIPLGALQADDFFHAQAGGR